ncbi:MAG: hypothetical protein HW394_345 [Acidobacteria bacterium]|nr:hypothetical protein [Acidobacteriota bacterium]
MAPGPWGSFSHTPAQQAGPNTRSSPQFGCVGYVGRAFTARLGAP